MFRGSRPGPPRGADIGSQARGVNGIASRVVGRGSAWLRPENKSRQGWRWGGRGQSAHGPQATGGIGLQGPHWLPGVAFTKEGQGGVWDRGRGVGHGKVVRTDGLTGSLSLDGAAHVLKSQFVCLSDSPPC